MNKRDSRLSRISPRVVKQALEYGILPIKTGDSKKYICDKSAPSWHQVAEWAELPMIRDHLIFLSRENFQSLIAQEMRGQLRFLISWELNRVKPHFSSTPSITGKQTLFLILILCLFLSCLFISLKWTILIVGSLLTVGFLSLSFTRLIAGLQFNTTPKASNEPETAYESLPSFSILVPLLHEDRVLKQLLTALQRLNYPDEKLEVFFLVEQADHITLKEFGKFCLPKNFSIKIVPRGLPLTKPRALNYGLIFSNGDIISIFDAEDIPTPDQLLQTVTAFENSPSNTACVQAQLSIYNQHQNWLTQMFSYEYQVLFQAYLPFLYRMNWAIPLGGTSNHFKIDILKSVGGWDAHNVTEDADLGIRLARLGYKTKLIQTTTEEEALSDLYSWMRQRSRWLKGWMQTYAVHMRHPHKLYKDLGFSGFLGFQITIGMMIVSVLGHPFFWLVLIAEWIYVPFVSVDTGLNLASIISAVTLIIGYVSYGFLGWRTLKDSHFLEKVKFVVSLPFYWILISASGYLALKDFATKPYHWHKSPHKGWTLKSIATSSKGRFTKTILHLLSVYGQLILDTKK